MLPDTTNNKPTMYQGLVLYRPVKASISVPEEELELPASNLPAVEHDTLDADDAHLATPVATAPIGLSTSPAGAVTTAAVTVHEVHDDGHAHAHAAATIPAGHTVAPAVAAPADTEIAVSNPVAAGVTAVHDNAHDDHSHDDDAHGVVAASVATTDRIVVAVKADVAPGDEAAAAAQPELNDVYAFFPQKDYIPNADGDQILQIQV